jgi:hypothetical protein
MDVEANGQEPVGPDKGPTGPSEKDEEQVLRMIYGEPDHRGFYVGMSGDEE